jgi:hypothetical protein
MDTLTLAAHQVSYANSHIFLELTVSILKIDVRDLL